MKGVPLVMACPLSERSGSGLRVKTFSAAWAAKNEIVVLLGF